VTSAAAGMAKAQLVLEPWNLKGVKNMLESLWATMRAWFLPPKQKTAAVSDTERKLWGLLIARLKDNRPLPSPVTGNRQIPNLAERQVR
jgi:hypothetical protein